MIKIILFRKTEISLALAGFLCVCINNEARTIPFTIQNNLKSNIVYAPLGSKNMPAHKDDLNSCDKRFLKKKTARIGGVSNGGVGSETIEGDGFPQLLFQIEGDPELYVYEFSAQPYDGISVVIEKGPHVVPKLAPLRNNIQAQDITRTSYEETVNAKKKVKTIVDQQQEIADQLKNVAQQFTNMAQQFADSFQATIEQQQNILHEMRTVTQDLAEALRTTKLLPEPSNVTTNP